jgi:hypothetical protein
MSALALEQTSCQSKSLFLQKMAYPKTMASKVVYDCPELEEIRDAGFTY